MESCLLIHASDTIVRAMASYAMRYDPNARARAKRAARAKDQRALSSGRGSLVELKRKNEVFAPLIDSAQIVLSASRSLG
jgi:hypothetical protein